MEEENPHLITPYLVYYFDDQKIKISKIILWNSYTKKRWIVLDRVQDKPSPFSDAPYLPSPFSCWPAEYEYTPSRIISGIFIHEVVEQLGLDFYYIEDETRDA